jgi:enoyl-CoA hydratase/carnithine racemase
MGEIEYEVKSKIAYITLNRPKKLNAITIPMLDNLIDICRRFNEDGSAWVAILSGKGRAFCTGIDLGEQKGQQIDVDNLYLAILGIKKPIIAALHGYCLAQGAGIALLCDIRIAAEGTLFGWPQVKRGMISISGSCIAPKYLPLNLIYEYLFNGELFDTSIASKFNLINKIVPLDKLLITAEEIAFKISENAPLAVQGTKEAIINGLELPLKERLKIAKNIQNRIKQSKDYFEGIKAFSEKRKAIWIGE